MFFTAGIIILVFLTACGSGGGGGSAAPTTTTPSIPGGAPSAPLVGGGGNQPTALTYYTLVKNLSVQNAGGPVYHVTVTGHCVVYNSNTYCWDDGWQHVIPLNYETDFWGFCNNGVTVGQCSGGGWADPLLAPTLWTATLSGVPTPIHTPAEVVSQGIATDVSCTLAGAVLDCVDFSIDTAQVPL